MQYVVGGTVTGALFAISALALVLTFKTSRVFNFAQGGEAFFIAYVYYELVVKAGVSPVLALPISVLGCGGLLGFFLWWVLFRHLTHAPQMVRLTATIGLQVAIVAGTVVIFGNHLILQQVGIVHGNSALLHVGGVGLNGNQLWTLGTGAVIAVAAAFALHRTHLGVLVRGVVDSPEISAGLGINPSLVSAGTWVIGTMMVGMVGILLVPVLGLDSGGYQTLIAASFAAAIVGRLTSLSVSFLAGLGLGILQSILIPVLPTNGILGTGLPLSLPFIVIIVTLVVWGWLGLAPKEAVTSSQMNSAPIPTLRGGPGNWDRYVGWAILIGMVFALPHLLSSFWLGLVAGSVALAVALVSWRVITGEAGVISLAQASLAAIGGSFAAKVAIDSNLPVGVAMLVGAVTAGAVGVVLGGLILPLGPLYTALATFAFGLFVDNMLLQNGVFDKYNAGLPISRPAIGPISTHSNVAFYFFVIVLFVLVAWLLRNLRDSTRGMILAAVRSKPGRAATIGVHVTSTRLFSFALASFVAGLGGAVYASFQGNALPDALTTPQGLIWFAVLMLSGMRSFGGSVAAGLSLVLIPEVLTRYTNATVENLLPLLFGLGAIHFAKQPAGAATLMRLRMRSWAVLLERLWGRVVGKTRMRRAEVAIPITAAAGSAGDGSSKATAGRGPALDEQLGLEWREAQPEPSRTAASDVLLHTRAVAVSFAGVRALTDVDFRVGYGQVLGLIGPNGAGKTTLLGVLSGVQKPDSGDVYFLGQGITHETPTSRAELGIARTFQVPALADDLTVQEHLLLARRLRQRCWDVWWDLLGARPRRTTPDELAAIDDLLQRLGIGGVASRYPMELPLGTQRLAEVAQSVMREPQLLLLDEPSAGLDSLETQAFAKVLESLRRETGMSIVLVEHDLQFVLGSCDQVVVLDFGKILAEGTPGEIRTNPAVLTAYFGEPVKAEG
jgi:ABC-type branched-subunit amino acid transport system ATPase component/branched-subunit amino acid ABC-type transport system permease component